MGGRVIMNLATCMTTSWDDGNPLDLRVAELLTKYDLRGTFYVPMTTEKATMTSIQIRELSLAFEMGAHTLHHPVLTRATDKQAWQEIAGSKSWLENITGMPCLMFCPPQGKYATRHLEMVRRAGFLGLRSVELGSLDFSRRKAGLMLLPTTIQAHPQGLITFGKNAIKRLAFHNLWRFIVHGRSTDWPKLARSFLRDAIKCGGLFHLWGHSWELQEAGQWQRLDEVLRFMGESSSQAPSLTNGQVCQRSLSLVASVNDAAQGPNMVRGES
jgi:hypothetical protein